MTRKEIREAVARFKADPNRAFSEALLAEAAGISHSTFRLVFDKNNEMPEWVQIRMERVLKALAAGELRIMRNRDRTKYVEYRREPKPDMQRGIRLELKNGRISINPGLRNLNDYSQPSLKEQLEK